MAEIASAFVSLMPSAKGFGSKLNSQVGPEIDKAGKKGGLSFGKLFAAGAALGIGAKAFSFLGDSLAEATDAAVVGSRTENVIAKMGNAANISAGQVGKLAMAISNKTGIDDEAIQSGQNLLLTFGNIKNAAGEGNDIFNQTSKLMVDMSAAMGTDAKGSAVQLGKALNDPVKGLTALSRVGVSFTEQQKKQIEGFVEAGDTMKAQKIILGELDRQFGGAAAAMTTPAEKAKVAWGNLKEQLGTAMLPAFNTVASGATKLLTVFQNKGLSGVGTLIGTKIQAALPVIKAKLAAWGMAFWEWVQKAAPPLLVKLGGLLARLGQWIGGTALPWLASKLVAWGKAFVEWIGPQIPPMLTKLGQLASRLFAWLLDVGLPRLLNNLKKWGEALVKWIGPKIPVVIKEIAKLLGKLVAWVVTTGLPKLLGALLRLGVALVKWIGPQIPKVLAEIGKLLVRLNAWIIGTGLPMLADKLRTMGSKAFEALKDAAKQKAIELLVWTSTIPGKVLSALGDLASTLYGAGQRLIQGLIDGISSKIAAVGAKMSELASKVKGFLPGSPIKWGPLKNWNNGGAGKRLMDLVTLGITKGTPKTIKAAEEAFGKIGDALKSTRSDLQSTLEGLKSDFAGLADSVAQAFTGDLFGVTATEAVAGSGGVAAIAAKSVGENFISNLMAKKGELTGLLTSFQTLKGWGLDPSFLSQLFASGNGALITELAGMGQAGALNAGGLFADVTSLGSQLGGAVATNDPVTGRIDETNRLLTTVSNQLGYLGDDIGKELNQVAAKAKRKRKGRK